MARSRIAIFDTTLRDGEQSPGYTMGVQEKLHMARKLDQLGVDIIEAGFPIASEDDFNAVSLIAGAVRRPVIAGLARAGDADIRRAWAALEGAARRRQRRATDVVGDVEVTVVDPHRPGQPHRHFTDLLPVPWHLWQPLFHGGQQRLIAQPGTRLPQDRQ